MLNIEMVPTKTAELLFRAEAMGTQGIIEELNRENEDLRLENETLKKLLEESGIQL